MTIDSDASLGPKSEMTQKSGDGPKLGHVDLGSASDTPGRARASDADAEALLGWMAARGPGPITTRTIGDAGPRSVRRKSVMDAATAILIERGDIVEVSSKPRAFRVSAQIGPKLNEPSASEIRIKHSQLLAERHDLPDCAASYIAAVDLRQWMLKQLGFRDPECDRRDEIADDYIMDAFGCASESSAANDHNHQTRIDP